MRKKTIAAAVCFLLSGSLTLAAKDSGKRVVEDITLPQGNLLTWIATLNGAIQPNDSHPPVAFVPVLPSIKTRSCGTSDAALSRWATNTLETLRQSLHGPDIDWGVLRIHTSLRLRYISVDEVFRLFQSVYGCRIVEHDGLYRVFPFPESLEAVCYSVSGSGRWPDELTLIKNVFEGKTHVFLHADKAERKIYMLAPHSIHREVSELIRESDLPVKSSDENQTGE